MRILILSVFMAIAVTSFSQDSTSQTILVLTLVKDWDKYGKKYYFSIYADAGVKGAESLYRLKYLESIPRDIRLININKDSMEYNYFVNESAALNYMTSLGWRLRQIIPEMRSTSTTVMESYVSNFNYPQILPVAKYFFEKTTE